MNRFRYSPLDAKSSQIRILAILPSWRRSSPLKCELIHVDLDRIQDAPFAFYEALSYTWGNPTVLESISLNGYRFHVTRNLGAALRRLRARKSRNNTITYIWADAICINQDNVAERNNQVLMMKLIYERAEQVLIWLGEAADRSGVAMDLVDRMTDADTPDDWISTSLQNPSDLPQWQALARLFARPYWRRVWVRQETAVASEIMILCGNRKQKWPTLVQACEFLYSDRHLFEPIAARLSPYASGFHQVIFLDTIRESIQECGSVGFQHMLFHNRACEATDTRDRIFAAIGIVGDDAPGIRPDYTLTKAAVFEEAVLTLITNTKSLGILSACDDPQRVSGLPSWVPNFEADWKAVVLRPKEGGRDLYHPARNMPLELSVPQRDNTKFLSLKGILCDFIETVGPVWNGNNTNKTVKIWCGISTNTLKSHQPPLTDDDIFDAFWRTLIADQDVNGNRASVERTFKSVSLHIKDTGKRPIPIMDFEEWESSGNRTSEFRNRFDEVAVDRRLFGTRHGRIGIGNQEVQEGDCICILYGAGVPFVLRPEFDYNVIVGETYVHGIMDGEVIRQFEDGSIEAQEFILY